MQFKVLAFLLFSSSVVSAQQRIIKGIVSGSDGSPVPEVNIQSENGKGTSTNEDGYYELNIQNPTVVLRFTHINFKTIVDTLNVPESGITYNVTLRPDSTVLNQINVIDRSLEDRPGVTFLKSKDFEALPAATQDISRVLISLPGVISNNELSTSYSVRGGNFDENMIFVEGIPIYRPQISSNGQQEGLGFVNTSMVNQVNFSSGGWRANYGDKLSSLLMVDYIEPKDLMVEASISLLGGSATLGGKVGNTSYLAGIRHKNTRYLLNTLDVQGEYFPRFTDIQFYTNTLLNPKTNLILLGGYANNRYEVFPSSRSTEFGTFFQSFRLDVGLTGRDLLQYDTYQGGLKLTHLITNKWTASLIASAVNTSEREYTEVEGGYRLCDVNKNIGSSGFNECVTIRGIGSLYDHRRNYLRGERYVLQGETEMEISNSLALKGGISWNMEDFQDRVSEFSFIDSADFVTEIRQVTADNLLERTWVNGFVQADYNKGQHHINVGTRINYMSLNDELTFSPRLQYSFKPLSNDQVVWKFATGVYRQVPIYREYRGRDGQVNRNLRMQSSWHIIAGLDHDLTLWSRPFKFLSEVYYKRLWNVNAYDVDNVRIRYFANNNAKAYAYGADLRLSGEFIPNTESWFSLGLLSAREDIAEDDQGYIRRPMDQRFTMSIYFSDHLPANPSFRVNVLVQIGSGLPFGPPDAINSRNGFNGDAYRRVDIGFSKVFKEWKGIEEFRISAEVLNLTGTENAISYTWLEDVYNQQFAVPNTLSARFLNLKLSISI